MADAERFYDVIIIGGGPAGLSAAIYLCRAKYRVLVLEKESFGGQITITHEVVNYPGVGLCSGKELTDTMYQQASYFGADFLIAEATGLQLEGDVKIVSTNRGEYRCIGVLLATGAHPRTVGFKGEEEYKGRGVAYCATCDGEFFTGKEVFVIGGGFAAAEESVFLTKFAKHVTILIRGEDFSCAAAVADEARNHEKIDVITNTEVEEVSGENGLEYIRYRNLLTGKITEYRAEEGDSFGVFVFAGYAPESGLVKDIVDLDENGYVITEQTQKTNVDGLYAAGDICVKPLRQVVTATSDGALAATELEKYVAKVQERTGLKAKEPSIRKNVPQKTEAEKKQSGLFTETMKTQLDTVFGKMEKKLVLKLYLDSRGISAELKAYAEELAAMTDKLRVEIAEGDREEYTPCVRLFREDDSYTGLAFHGVPGGHEFTSFVLGLYNAAGPGQTLEEDIKLRIQSLKKPVDIKILVSLSCTMCPDLVVAAQHIAALGDGILAEVFDISHFENLKNKYKVMSVPCMVIDNTRISFGKKSMQQLLELIDGSAVISEQK